MRAVSKGAYILRTKLYPSRAFNRVENSRTVTRYSELPAVHRCIDPGRVFRCVPGGQYTPRRGRSNGAKKTNLSTPQNGWDRRIGMYQMGARLMGCCKRVCIWDSLMRIGDETRAQSGQAHPEQGDIEKEGLTKQQPKFARIRKRPSRVQGFRHCTTILERIHLSEQGKAFQIQAMLTSIFNSADTCPLIVRSIRQRHP